MIHTWVWNLIHAIWNIHARLVVDNRESVMQACDLEPVFRDSNLEFVNRVSD